MREVKKRKDKVATALVLCFSVVALTSVFAVKSNLGKIDGGSKDINVSKKTTVESQSPTTPTKSVTNTVVDSKKQSGSTQNAEYISPVKGKILVEYSMDMPIYSKTLDQYMTHPGVDIEAPMSSPVKAIAPGTVTRVADDDRYGSTVEIKHNNGMVSIYSNLAKTDLVEVGDHVKQGYKIGIVGETALFESLEVAHLHFEMTKNTAFVDPTQYVKSL